jgi:hypothetical protein
MRRGVPRDMTTPLKITIFMGRGECQTHGGFL